ncbi:hypothetical protein HOU02_gp496 [Caulobacter phage CcrBL9]|uniref:Uncharacterized protein n=1 Tax=Caulobacter phage CcrBL9 TaxID=2283270 RepID=A0A385EEV6_9CAUD|nr:hypothetical protein HOU02_gp496 [Caulobacter phage CcrBL9]AXQ69229.1 hypothetical protein CcrBL9_gp205 [Caulobacter phage CcrBL9]
MFKLLLAILSILSGIAAIAIPVVAWFTHVIHCLMTHDWVFLIVGALAFPVAIIHGIGIWFGLW